MPVEFIDQLEDDAGAEKVDLFNVTLATKPLRLPTLRRSKKVPHERRNP